MKKYWLILILAVIVGISVPVVIIYNAVPHAPKPVMVYLNTDSMKEVGNWVVNSTHGPSIIAVYPAYKKNNSGEPVPWADLFLCRSSNKADSLSGDILIAFIDTKTVKNFKVRDDITEFTAGVEHAQKFKQCKIMIPLKLLDSLKHYKYKYGHVYIQSVDDF
jgi:hypothetical protein